MKADWIDFTTDRGRWCVTVTPLTFQSLTVPYIRPCLTFKNSTWCSPCVQCFVRISEQTATFAVYIIKRLVFITVCKVFTARYGLISYTKQIKFSLQKVKDILRFMKEGFLTS